MRESILLNEKVIDLFVVFLFLKKLVTDYKSWDAYKTGVIDAQGNIIVPKKDRTPEQRRSFTKFDLMVKKLRGLLHSIPGGRSRIASYLAALWLIKEQNHAEDFDELLIESSFIKFYNRSIQDHTLMEQIRHAIIREKKYLQSTEEEIANSVGGGGIANIDKPLVQNVPKKKKKKSRYFYTTEFKNIPRLVRNMDKQAKLEVTKIPDLNGFRKGVVIALDAITESDNDSIFATKYRIRGMLIATRGLDETTRNAASFFNKYLPEIELDIIEESEAKTKFKEFVKSWTNKSH